MNEDTDTQHLVEQVKRLEHENDNLRVLLAACQKALREMQAQRDAAREGQR